MEVGRTRRRWREKNWRSFLPPSLGKVLSLLFCFPFEGLYRRPLAHQLLFLTEWGNQERRTKTTRRTKRRRRTILLHFAFFPRYRHFLFERHSLRHRFYSLDFAVLTPLRKGLYWWPHKKVSFRSGTNKNGRGSQSPFRRAHTLTWYTEPYLRLWRLSLSCSSLVLMESSAFD